MAKKKKPDNTKQKSSRTKDDNKSKKRRIETPFLKVSKFYLDLAEQTTPKVKQAADDLYDFWLGATKTALKTQRTARDAVGIDSDLLNKSEELLDKAASEAVEAQKRALAVSTESYQKLLKMIQNELNVEDQGN
jgi:hypothetical protein